MRYTASELVAIAREEIGYLEKKSNADLDSKTGNAGSKNYTKYARDLHSAGYYQANKNGYEWCEVFNDWCHWIASGKDPKLAQEVIYQTGLYGAGCVWSANCYRKAGRFYTTPKVGDQIYFGTKGNESHTGIVSKVENGRVYTIEGNTSGASGVISNGGGVCEKSYSLSYDKIVGYGRPNYEEETEPKKTDGYTLVQFIKDVQKACGASVDGIAGTETISKTVTLSASKNRTHAAVKAVQKRLYALGYTMVGEADGIAGPKFTAAVIEFQEKNKCWVDGEITARHKTWKKLLGME
jgi:peptidoglycan hydrolase-like protein with peptidoglycan-binding domain